MAQGKKQTTGYTKLKEDTKAVKPEGKNPASAGSSFFSMNKAKAEAKAQFIEHYKDVAAQIHKSAFVYHRDAYNQSRQAPPMAKESVALAGDNIKIISKNEIGPERTTNNYKEGLRRLGMDPAGLKVTVKSQRFGQDLLEVEIPKKTVDAYLEKQAQKQQDTAPKIGSAGDE